MYSGHYVARLIRALIRPSREVSYFPNKVIIWFNLNNWLRSKVKMMSFFFFNKFIYLNKQINKQKSVEISRPLT